MSDKLEWLNKHFVAIKYTKINDIINEENYEIRPDLKSFYGTENAEKIVWDFAEAKRFKCACELMAYIAHTRSVVWWAYLCVKSLKDELQEVPAPSIDIDQIGTSFKPTVPDFAKVEPLKPNATQEKEYNDSISKMQNDIQKMREKCDPELLALTEKYLNIFYDEFKKVHGYSPMELIEIAGKKLARQREEGNLDMNSPIFQEVDKMKERLQTIRKETLDTIHTVIPPEDLETEKKLSKEILEAVYAWIVSPDETNSKICLDLGNKCPDKPEGLLSLSAFWGGGNLTPEGKNIVRTPKPLLPNGICQTLLMCALHKGGTRKLKERYEHYFNLGVEVLTGRKVWEEDIFNSSEKSLDNTNFQAKEKEVPKQEIQNNSTHEEELKIESIFNSNTITKPHFTRWKPKR
ncbi:MAG: hypothetical protein MJ247_01840 [Alphaproteobacteria bacterium]|nr:hypothetical protein [Alphaproteobacteria bacterium]